MNRSLPDLWEGCYDGEHRKEMSPQQFRETFCANCLNAGCRNSRAAGLKWVQRMLTQEDRLLENPLFADPQDPKYKQVRELDFQDMIKQALAIEVSTRKGDWSVPTEDEIGAAAAQMVGMIPSPSGYQAQPDEPELGEEPEPPARLVDEVQEYDLGREESVKGLAGVSHELPHLDEEGHMAPADAEEGLPLPPDTTPETEEVPQGRWRIRGDTGTIYEVVLHADDSWGCSCPSRENPCKHARDIALKLSRAPKDSVAAPKAPAAPEPPQQPTRPPQGPTSFVPRKTNTAQPSGGQMVGGETPPPTSPEHDPWAPPPIKPKEREIPVGGRVSFGTGKKKG